MQKSLYSALCFVLSVLLAVQTSPSFCQSSGSSAPSEMGDLLPSAPSTGAQSAVGPDVVIPRGTKIVLIVVDNVSSSTARKGQTVHMLVAQDVVVNGKVAIPAGTPATGILTDVRKAVRGRRDGFISAKARSITLADGSKLKLKEYAPGEDACGDMGPCWALFLIAAPFVVIMSPFFLISLLVRPDPRTAASRQLGIDAALPNSSCYEGYTATSRPVHSQDSVAPDFHPQSGQSFGACVTY